MPKKPFLNFTKWLDFVHDQNIPKVAYRVNGNRNKSWVSEYLQTSIKKKSICIML